MEKLIQFAKPELVVLSEKKKIRDYDDVIKKQYTIKLVAKLLSLLGVNEGKQDVHNALVFHIISAYQNYSYEQIDKAFELFVSGALNTKPFQQLNAVVFGQVMAEYSEYEREKTSIYHQRLKAFRQQATPMSDEDVDTFMKSQIENAIEEYKKSGAIEVPTAKYDYLFSKGKLQERYTKDEFDELKRSKYASVKSRLLEVYKNIKAVSINEKNKFREALSEIESAKSGIVITQCKLEILRDYFDNIINK